MADIYADIKKWKSMAVYKNNFYVRREVWMTYDMTHWQLLPPTDAAGDASACM